MRNVVVSLYSSSDYCPEGIRRSTMYARKRDSLPDGKLQTFWALEARAFTHIEQERSETASANRNRKLARFECNLGSVVYYFSESKKIYVLIDFDLKRGGGGRGTPQLGLAPKEWGRRMADCVGTAFAARISAVATYACGVAYLVNSAALAVRSAGSAMHRVAVRNLILLGAGNFGSHRRLATRHFAMSTTALKDVAQITAALTSRNEHLPDWSVLYPLVKSSEQLHNSFAQSILLGEWACRLGDQMQSEILVPSGRTNLTVNSCYRRQLFEESKLVIEALHPGKERLDKNSCELLCTASLIDDDFLVDDRRIHLVKSEVVYFMALAMRSEVKQMAASLRPLSAGSSFVLQNILQDGALDRAKLFRKYSLLCDFVRVSNHYFGVHSDLDREDPIKLFRGHGPRPGRAVGRYLRLLTSFGSCTSLLVDAFEPRRRVKEQQSDDMAQLKARLVGLASEILEVEKTAEFR